MSFLHHHAPHAAPAANETCLVIQADRLLAGADVSATAILPTIADLAEWKATAASPVHVGRLDQGSCWLVGVDEGEVAAPAGWAWHDTRSLLGVLTPGQSHAISCARQLWWWDRRNRFCGVCGTATEVSAEERARQCPKCGVLFFPAASPAVIVAVTRGEELLLAHNRNFRTGMFSLLAGFVDPGETLEQAVAREVREEVGIEIDGLRYVTSQPWSFPNSLMVGFRAQHVCGELKVDGKEIEQAGWFRRATLPDIPRVGTVARRLIDDWVRGA